MADLYKSFCTSVDDNFEGSRRIKDPANVDLNDSYISLG